MSYIRESISKMSSYIPGEKADSEGYIILNANENPYPASPAVEVAIKETIASLNYYPESSSVDVRETAAKLYCIDSECVMVTNSSDEMLRIICQACVNEGDKVCTFYPTFSFYKTLINVQGGICKEIDFEDDYSLPESIDFTGAKVLFFPNPGAPSGVVYGVESIRLLIEAAGDALVVIDEAYADFDNNENSVVSLVKEYKNLVVTKTFSKSYSLAGLRLGLGIGSPEVMRELHKVRDYYNVGLIPQNAANAALKDQEWLKGNCEKIIATREWFSRELENYAEVVYPSAANFVLAKFAEGVAEKLYLALKERKILVRYWDKPKLDESLRISIGTDEDMRVVLEAIAELLK